MMRTSKPHRNRSLVDPQTFDPGRLTLALRALHAGGGSFPFMGSPARPSGGGSSMLASLVATLVAVAALGVLTLVVVR